MAIELGPPDSDHGGSAAIVALIEQKVQGDWRKERSRATSGITNPHGIRVRMLCPAVAAAEDCPDWPPSDAHTRPGFII